MRRAFLWLPPFVYMGVIFALSAQSDPLPAVTRFVWDKALHVLEYTVLGVLLCRALHGEGLPMVRAALLAAALASGYGVTDETHQLFVPDRQAGADDWLADTGGGAAGAMLFNMVSHRRRRLRRSPPARSDQRKARAARAVRPSASADR
jgi:VanZ family protein